MKTNAKLMLTGFILLLIGQPTASAADMHRQWNCAMTSLRGPAAKPPEVLNGLMGFLYYSDADTAWQIRANSEDHIGSSRLRGSCGSDNHCALEQKYTSGVSAGRLVYFSYTLNSHTIKDGILRETYTGRWGDKPAASSHSGHASLELTCMMNVAPSQVMFNAIMRNRLGWKDEAF